MNIDKHIRICTPVVGKTVDEFIINLNKTQEISNLVELRVDSIEHLTIEDLRPIKAATKKRAIFTCRRKDEGGDFDGIERDRMRILQRGIGLFEFVDIELSTVKQADFSCDDNTKIILSYHNFDETPSYWVMQKIIFEMNKFKPDIVKIATMVQKEYEVSNIYRLLTNKPHEEARIIIGMGEKGRVTRILGPLLGGYLTYASTEFGESAPGQIDVYDMKNIYNTLLSRT